MRIMSTPAPAFHSFECTHTVIIDHPLAKVFPVLAYGNNLERLTRACYDMCTDFEVYGADTVKPSAPLSEAYVRTLPASSSGLPRHFFRMEETIPFFFGLYCPKINVFGSHTWDEGSKMALYEALTEDGIFIWKLRVIEEVVVDDYTKSQVTETLRITCPFWLRAISQSTAVPAHQLFMSKYHLLFE